MPDFCFKDGAHKLQQQENVERIDKETNTGYSNSNNTAQNYSSNQLNQSSQSGQNNFNITSANNFQNTNSKEYLQRKKIRKGKKGFQKNEDANTSVATPNEFKRKDLVFSSGPSTTGNNTNMAETEIKSNAETVGVKLICDTPNEELKKYFAKTVIIILKYLEALYE